MNVIVRKIFNKIYYKSANELRRSSFYGEQNTFNDKTSLYKNQERCKVAGWKH